MDELFYFPMPKSRSPDLEGYAVASFSRDDPSAVKITQALTMPQGSHVLEHLPPHLLLTPADIHIIISMKSGANQAEEVFEKALKPTLGLAGLDARRCQVLRTESTDTIKEFATGPLRERANRGVAQTVVLLSGDGGVVDVINELMGGATPRSSNYIRPTLVLIPMGTGNALFHSLHRRLPPLDVPDFIPALRTLLWGHALPLPVFRTAFSPGAVLLTNSGTATAPLPGPDGNTLYGAIVASYGLHATLVADSDTAEWRQHGSARFGMVARELLSAPHAYRATLIFKRCGKAGMEVEEVVLLGRAEHGYVLLSLVSNLEKSFVVSPASEPLDGVMHLVHFGPETGEEVGRLMALAYQGGRHVEETEQVAYEVVRGMRIEFLEQDGDEGPDGDRVPMEGRWRRVCVDGLIVRVEEEGWMEVEDVLEEEWPVEIVVYQP